MLWNIPITEEAFANRVPEAIESDSIDDLYALYRDYADHLKAQSRRKS